MKMIDLGEIQGVLDIDMAFVAIREGFIAQSRGLVTMGAVGHLAFPDVSGDCHIKSAARADSDIFVVKIASGFAGNEACGLPTSQGMMLIFSAHTGRPLALLQDEGWLTDQRTALAGALAVKAIAPLATRVLGVVGTGVQARLQAIQAVRFAGIKRIVLWGRDREKSIRLCAELTACGLSVLISDTLPELVQLSDVIVTTTAARTPLLTAAMFDRPPRIVAIGADAVGKQEIASDLTASLSILVADSPVQCLGHGELAHPFAAGLIKADAVTTLGDLLECSVIFDTHQSALVDLTGLGVQDLQIASVVWAALRDQRS